LPEDMIAVATEQAKEIQLAYDLITRNKQMARASGSPPGA